MKVFYSKASDDEVFPSVISKTADQLTPEEWVDHDILMAAAKSKRTTVCNVVSAHSDYSMRSLSRQYGVTVEEQYTGRKKVVTFDSSNDDDGIRNALYYILDQFYLIPKENDKWTDKT